MKKKIEKKKISLYEKKYYIGSTQDDIQFVSDLMQTFIELTSN